MGVKDKYQNEVDKYAQQQQAASGQYIQQAQQALDEQNRQTQEQIGVIDNANQQAEASFYNIVNQRNQELQNAQKENDILTNAETKRNTWAAATEMATAIANLAGVARGASNQQYQGMTQNWMREADANRKHRQSRLDAIKDKQAQAQMHLAQLRQGNTTNLAQLKISAADKQANGRLGIAKEAYGAQTDINKTQMSATMQGIGAEQQESMAKSSKDVTMLANGFVPDASAPGGYRYDESLAMDRAAANAKASAAAGGGSGSSSNINLTVKGNATGGKAEVINIKPESLRANVLAHISRVSDLSEEQKTQVSGLINQLSAAGSTGKNAEEISRRLITFINDSKELYDLVKISAGGAQVMSAPGSGVQAPQSSGVTSRYGWAGAKQVN